MKAKILKLDIERLVSEIEKEKLVAEKDTELAEKLSREYDEAALKLSKALESQYYRSGIDFLISEEELWFTEKAVTALNFNPAIHSPYQEIIEASSALDKFNGYE